MNEVKVFYNYMRKFKIAYLRFLRTGKIRIRLEEKDFDYIKEMYLDAMDLLKNYREILDESLLNYNKMENNILAKAIFYIAVAIKYGYKFNKSFYERIKKEIENLKLNVATHVYLPNKKISIITGQLFMKVKGRNLAIFYKDTDGKLSKVLEV